MYGEWILNFAAHLKAALQVGEKSSSSMVGQMSSFLGLRCFCASHPAKEGSRDLIVMMIEFVNKIHMVYFYSNLVSNQTVRQ